MEIMRTGESHRSRTAWALLPLLVGVLLLAGCAQVAYGPPVTSPAEVPPQATPTATPDVSGADEPEPAGTEADPEVAADAEVVADAEVATDDDVQAAEEVEPSPLDELPETAPEVSPSTLEKDKQLVAEAFPTFDIPMVLNTQVVAYIEYFSTRHKEFFSASLVRSGRYVAAFQSVFEQAGIPTDLVYMAHVESAFKTNAYSRAKAKGIYQFIAATGRRYGLRIDSWVDERSDPVKSAHAAAAYLKDLHGMFGDWYLALAAYNAGEGKIQRSLAKTKKDDFWSLASTRSLRAETRNYVPAILAATLIAKQPAKFGFEVSLDPPFVSDVVGIEGQTDLRILARLADVDPETLRQLNPQLRRGMTPPGATTDVHVPVGLGASLAQAYATLPVADRLVLARHQVGKGESVAIIARHYGVTSTAISNANRLGKNASVRPGQELIIPAVAPTVREVDGSRTNAVTYRVRKGDTLSRIATQYRTTASAIASASGIGLHSSLRVGQRLVIPARRQSARASVSTARVDQAGATSAVVHTVRRGETLYRIADRYQVTVNQICALNRINPDGVIYPGTRLKIRAN
jgi:membrane-bound lytic murein transglycosylase D